MFDRFNAKFNKLTKTVGHHAHFFFFSKKDVEYDVTKH